MKWVESSARQISLHAKGETIVVEKSTLPVKTAETIKEILLSNRNPSGVDKSAEKFYVLSNPEFLAEGSAIFNLESPDRVLIGGDNKNAIDALKDIYLNLWV